MKKVIAFVVVLCLFCCGIALADNSARIKELQEQQQIVAQDIIKVQQSIIKAQQFIKQKEAELMQLKGGIDELMRQDELAKLAEKETPKR